MNYGVFRLVFSKAIPTTINDECLPNPEDHIKHRGFFSFSSVGLVVLVLAYVLGSWFGIPLVVIAVFGAGLGPNLTVIGSLATPLMVILSSVALWFSLVLLNCR